MLDKFINVWVLFIFMNFVSRTISGSVMIVIGLFLIGISYRAKFIPLIYGIPLLILGFFVLLNKKEDKIEEIRKVKGGKRK